MTETQIVEKLLEGDKEFKRIYFEHRELNEIIDRFESKDTLTLEDETEVKRLKKIKLSLKDRMESIIRQSESK